MLIIDVPDNPPQTVYVALQTTAEQRMPSEADLQSLYGSMGVCMNSPTRENMRLEDKGLATDAYYAKGLPLWPQATALRNLEDSDDVAVQLAADTASVFILQKPNHGTVVTSEAGFNYLPDSGYEGKDQVVFLVNIDGRVVKTIYYLKVFDPALNKGEDNNQKLNKLFKGYCPVEKDWKISSFTPDEAFPFFLASYTGRIQK